MRIETNQTFPVERTGEAHIVEFKVDRPLTPDEANNLFAAVGFGCKECKEFEAASFSGNIAVSVNKGIWENFIYVTGTKILPSRVVEFVESLPA